MRFPPSALARSAWGRAAGSNPAPISITMKKITSFNCIAYVGHSLEKTVVTVDAKTTREAWGKADAALRKTNRIVQMLDIKEVGNV